MCHYLALDNLKDVAIVITHVTKSDFHPYSLLLVSELREPWNQTNGFFTS